MMKKILCMIAAAMLLLTSACAEEYQSITDMTEPARWTADYQVGKNTVTIDVQPTIPDVDAMPVLKVAPSFWVPEAADGAAWTASRQGDGEMLSESFTIRMMDAMPVYHVDTVYPPFDDSAAYLSGLTLGQMKTTLEQIFSEMKGAVYGYDTSHVDNLKIQKDQNGSAIAMHFNQTVRGVPLWDHAINSVSGRLETEQNCSPKYSLVMKADGSYLLSGNTVRETAVLTEDVPLCGFDKVKATLEAAIIAGHVRAVYSVDLGYALYNEPGTSRPDDGNREWMLTAEFYAQPVWRVRCLYVSDANIKLEASVLKNPITSKAWKLLYINAQTGELLDPDYVGRGSADYAGFISWENVQ